MNRVPINNTLNILYVYIVRKCGAQALSKYIVRKCALSLSLSLSL